MKITIVTYYGKSAVYVNGERVTIEQGHDHDEVGWADVWDHVLGDVAEVEGIGFDDETLDWVYFPDTLDEVLEEL